MEIYRDSKYFRPLWYDRGYDPFITLNKFFFRRPRVRKARWRILQKRVKYKNYKIFQLLQRTRLKKNIFIICNALYRNTL